MQIWQHNMQHSNIIVMKNGIILEKTREKEKLSEDLADRSVLAELARASSPVNLAWRYRWAMSKTDIESAEKLGLTGVKNYWRHAGQVEMELD